MIFKELDPFASADKFLVAGRKAEEQMAHYLRRFFGGSEQVDVINYLRVELDGEVAQIDHLVLHSHGLVIVESKSVAGSVQIKDDGAVDPVVQQGTARNAVTNYPSSNAVNAPAGSLGQSRPTEGLLRQRRD